MDFLGLLKDLIAMVVIGNVVTGHKDDSATEDYLDSLEKILSFGNNNN